MVYVKQYDISNRSISFQYNMLSRIFLKQRRPDLIQRLVSRGVLYSKKKIKRYKRLGLAALITKKIIFQQFYYLFLSRLLKWLKLKIIDNRLKIRGCECFSLKLIRFFYFYSIRRDNKRMYDFLGGIPNTILPRHYKYLIFSRARRFLKPVATKFINFKNVFGQIHKNVGSTYFEYGYPSYSWIVNFFKKKKNKYKLSWLHLFSGYRGRRIFQHRRYRRKKQWHRRGHKIIPSKYKVSTLKNNSIVSSEIRAEAYLKYFYDYSIYDLHKISYRFSKLFSFCNLGLVFYFLNKRLDFLVHRRFCNFRMSIIREILKKGLVFVNGIIIKDPSYIVRTGQLISFNLVANDLNTSYIVGLFLAIYSIRNSILRVALKLKLYNILVHYLKYKQICLKIPFFKENTTIKNQYDDKFLDLRKNYLNKLQRDKKNKKLKLLNKRLRQSSKLKKKNQDSFFSKKKTMNPISSSISKLKTPRPIRSRHNVNQKRHYYSRSNKFTKFSRYTKKKKDTRQPYKFSNDKNNRSYKNKKSNYFSISIRKQKYKKNHFRKPRFKKSIIHYKDKQSCKKSFICERQFRVLLNRNLSKGRRRYLDRFSSKDKYLIIYKKSARIIRKFKKKSVEFSTLSGEYNVLNWEKEYSHNVRFLKHSKHKILIKYLKQTKLNVLSVFLSICRKQRYFLHNLNLYINLNIEKSEYLSLLRYLKYVHFKYRGVIKRDFRYRRIRSFGIKLFIKSLKNKNNYFHSSNTKKNELYNIIIHSTPTKFHKLFKISNYLLLLRYRVVIPYFYDDDTYFHFECLRINPLTYIRRGSLVYENRPGSSKMILRNHWFRKNKYYLP